MNIHTGSNYNPQEDVAVTAKRIRAEIKDRVRQCTLPNWTYSVRISRFSMGRSIDVTITVPGTEYTDVWYPSQFARNVKTTVEIVVNTFKETRDSGWPDDYYQTTFYSNVTLTNKDWAR